jgi:hypothetical protein
MSDRRCPVTCSDELVPRLGRPILVHSSADRAVATVSKAPTWAITLWRETLG